MRTDFTEVFAVPGERSIIDGVHPHTGRSIINNNTLEEIRQREPHAVQMPWEDWRQQQIARQQTPITWHRIDLHRYNEMLAVLPPLDWKNGGFLCSEPWDHDMATGRPRYAAFINRGYDCFESSRPLTRQEFKEFKDLHS